MDENVNRRKKLGGKIIHSQAKEMIFNIYNFMKREAQEGPILLQQVQKRVAEATGVSRSSIQRILKENKTPKSPRQPTFSTPKKKWKKVNKKTSTDDFEKTVIRRTVHEFHTNEGQRPTLKSLLPIVREKIGFRGGIWSLRQVLKELKFKWRKSQDNRKVLIEKHEIREQRVRFIRNIKQYRREGRPIVYTDETYIHASHTKPHSWSDDSKSGLLKPISKGQYAIIVHAGNEKGFVEGASLIYKSGHKSGDYHDAMNFTNYKKWLIEKLIPNLPPKSVVVVDNASYHNKQLNPAPNSNAKKGDMIGWLIKHNIPFQETMLKPELYQLIKLHKSTNKMYYIDSILAEHNHSVLRLPPYHPDLNPIEMIWAVLKNYVASKNTTFNLNHCIELVKEKMSQITSEEWRKRCEHARDIEDKYMVNEAAVDAISERFVINVQDDSDSDSSNDSVNIDDPDAEFSNDDSDGAMSGVECL